jgi:hypothetical protein
MNTQKLLFPFVIILGLFVLPFCDKIEDPLKEQNETCGNENGAVPIKKILIEDYTGHLCGNCPAAASEMERLKNIYCDHLVPLAIHTGFFARPVEDYPSDFRTQTGDTYDAHYKATNMGLPRGVINRTEFEGQFPLSYQAQWQAAIEQQLSQPADAYIHISNSYDADSRIVNVEVTAEYFTDFSGELSLTVLLAEDSITAPQKDYSLDPQRIENYVHRHVLRESLTDDWGQIIQQETARGDITEHRFSIELNENFNARHCEIIAFISYAESREVIQAESEPVL